MTAAKRIMDVVFAALLLVILAPVIAVVGDVFEANGEPRDTIYLRNV